MGALSGPVSGGTHLAISGDGLGTSPTVLIAGHRAAVVSSEGSGAGDHRGHAGGFASVGRPDPGRQRGRAVARSGRLPVRRGARNLLVTTQAEPDQLLVAEPAAAGPVGPAASALAATWSVTSLLAVLTKVGPPLTVVTALLIYFGWARADAQSKAMGVDVSMFGYSTQDYVLRSISTLYLPLLVIAGLGLGWLAVDRYLTEPADTRRRRGTGCTAWVPSRCSPGRWPRWAPSSGPGRVPAAAISSYPSSWRAARPSQRTVRAFGDGPAPSGLTARRQRRPPSGRCAPCWSAGSSRWRCSGSSRRTPGWSVAAMPSGSRARPTVCPR